MRSGPSLPSRTALGLRLRTDRTPVRAGTRREPRGAAMPRARRASCDPRLLICPFRGSAIARRVLHDPFDQLAEGAAAMGGELGHERRPCHSGLGVDLKADQFPRALWPVVVAKVGATDPTAAQCPMSR